MGPGTRRDKTDPGGARPHHAEDQSQSSARPVPAGTKDRNKDVAGREPSEITRPAVGHLAGRSQASGRTPPPPRGADRSRARRIGIGPAGRIDPGRGQRRPARPGRRPRPAGWRFPHPARMPTAGPHRVGRRASGIQPASPRRPAAAGRTDRLDPDRSGRFLSGWGVPSSRPAPLCDRSTRRVSAAETSGPRRQAHQDPPRGVRPGQADGDPGLRRAAQPPPSLPVDRDRDGTAGRQQ